MHRHDGDDSLAAMKGDAAQFRRFVRDWIAANCPPALYGSEYIYHGGKKEAVHQDVIDWCARCHAMGWTVPDWPCEYGGAGLDLDRQLILREELDRVNAPLPLNGMGVTMIGPAILEYGTAEQKAQHLPLIATGAIRWCQGFSETNAGSDLAAVRTTAVRNGDQFLVNGSKLWTTYGDLSDWMFCLVRTGEHKHKGLSILLFPMDSPGLSTRPIDLISGRSVFCACFFDDVAVPAHDLLGPENESWPIAKRILQFERMSVSRAGSTINSGPGSGEGGDGRSVSSIVRPYLAGGDGRIADTDMRRQIAALEMKAAALTLLQRRFDEERDLADGCQPGHIPSIVNYLSTELTSRRMELLVNALAMRGIGWDGPPFNMLEIEVTRHWLYSKSFTIAGGCSEVQLDIISKQGLGLSE